MRRAAWRLALRMGCTLSELGERMSMEEFGDACAYLESEPIEPALVRALAEILAATANGPLTRKDKRLWSSEDFMPNNNG